MISAAWRGFAKAIEEESKMRHDKEMVDKEKEARFELEETKRKWDREDFWTALGEKRRDEYNQLATALRLGSGASGASGKKTTTTGGSTELNEAITWANNLAEEIGGEKGLELRAAVAANSNIALELEKKYYDEAKGWTDFGGLDLKTFASGVKLIGDISTEPEDYSALDGIMEDLKTANMADWEVAQGINTRLAEEKARLAKRSSNTFAYVPPDPGINKLHAAQTDAIGTMVRDKIKSRFDNLMAIEESQRSDKQIAELNRLNNQLENFDPGKEMGAETWQIFDEYLPEVIQTVRKMDPERVRLFRGLDGNVTFARYFDNAWWTGDGPADLAEGSGVPILNLLQEPIASLELTGFTGDETPTVDEESTSPQSPTTETAPDIRSRGERRIRRTNPPKVSEEDAREDAIAAANRAKEVMQVLTSIGSSAGEAGVSLGGGGEEPTSTSETPSLVRRRGDRRDSRKNITTTQEEAPLEEIQKGTEAGIKPRVIVDRIYRGKTIPAEKILEMNIRNGMLKPGDIVLMNGKKVQITEED